MAGAAVLLGTAVQNTSAVGPQTASAAPRADRTPPAAPLPSTPGSSALGPFRSYQKPAPAQSTRADHQVLMVLGSTTQVTGKTLGVRRDLQVRAPLTSASTVNAALRRAGAVSMRPLMPGLPVTQARQWNDAARATLGSGAVDLSKVQVVQLSGGDVSAAARALAATPGVVYAEPDRTVSPMNTGGVQLPSWASRAAGGAASSAKAPAGRTADSDGAGVPGNTGLSTSLQSFLNAGGVDATGAFSLLKKRFDQLPGTGETITNVSVGDLTDEGMVTRGDTYINQHLGPTTVIQDGQRYLDIPSMPLIPTYTSDAQGALDPTGSTEGQDPALGEVLLDFSVMAPLPHELQRAGMQGSGESDLLGIAPGAKYRLVVPQEPTFDQIAVALLAAARQQPRPDVITASLGYGTDDAGIPGRYLEDDPIQQAVIAAIVKQYGITVVVAANDGTRLFTNAAVGPDGGSTATDLARSAADTTTIADDQLSTTPSKVLDSGAIAAGGTTTDDTLSVPPQSGGSGSAQGTWATTRTDGSGIFSSGFGTRVNVSAPSDGIPAFEHRADSPQSVNVVLSGGTSASAPEIAAAAAVVLQTSRLTGQRPSPQQVRTLLERTGRAVSTPPQADQPLHVGPQLDVTAAVQEVLAHGRDKAAGTGAPRIVRISVAHRQTIGGLGATYLEATDPGRIDLSGPGTGDDAIGEGLVGPVTIGADVTGVGAQQGVHYALRIGSHEFTSATPAIRLTPTQILTAAGLPVIATSDRRVTVTFQVRQGSKVLASAGRALIFGPTDGTYAEALAPVVQPVVKAGHSVQVRYDLTGVRSLNTPALVVSGVGHWNPALAPIFTPSWTTPLTDLRGTVTVPAEAFAAGGGIYGIGVVQNPTGGFHSTPLYGEFSPVRVDGGSPAQRPAAPTLAAQASGPFGHLLEINRAAAEFSVRYDVSGIRGATGALLEFSAPGPNMYNSYNMVSNQNGTTRDHDGVDSPAALDRPLTGTRGTVQLSAAKLRLASSLAYDLRVFAVDRHGSVIGQASPTSLLAFDDGLTPDGATLNDFAVVPGGTSVAALESPAGTSSVYDYDAATGVYGRRLTNDPAYGSVYEVFGVDSENHTLVLHMTGSGAQSLETYDTLSGDTVGSPTQLDTQYVVDGGRVDAARHRAVVLVHRSSDRASFLLPVDMATGVQGDPIQLDTPDGATIYGLLDLDSSSGLVYAEQTGASINCRAAAGSANVAAVDLDTRTVTRTRSGSVCATSLAADGHGHLDETWYRSFSVNFAGTAMLTEVPTDGVSDAPTLNLDAAQGALALAVDSVHQLALVAFRFPVLRQSGFQQYTFNDNNATGRLAVVDLTTGTTVGTVTGVEYPVAGFYNGRLADHQERAVQLDPATRTGWTYAADGSQIQRFSY
ncbi:S8 family serine peptidase [Peterkaempfera sp. SMS 1(5)a]|uniref:S8 family serine peptidase n=1 Tax=Peterkaempfera podocarpi TaxID=3232308 RepID=UPI00367306C6